MRRTTTILAAALIALAGCGGGEGGPGAAGFPTRDWSGTYAIEVTNASTDCAGPQRPPPLESDSLRVTQAPDNSARAAMGPFLELRGGFDGDRMEARGEIDEPIQLPDSLQSRVTPADSLDAVRYHMTLDFGPDGFAGTYVIRAPDLVALARGKGGRCEVRYGLRGSSSAEPASPESPSPSDSE